MGSQRGSAGVTIQQRGRAIVAFKSGSSIGGERSDKKVSSEGSISSSSPRSGRPSPSQTSSLHGIIMNKQSNAVSDVIVTMSGISETRITNAKGEFQFLRLVPGNYQLTAKLEGFKTVVMKLKIKSGLNKIKIIMEPISKK